MLDEDVFDVTKLKVKVKLEYFTMPRYFSKTLHKTFALDDVWVLMRKNGSFPFNEVKSTP